MDDQLKLLEDAARIVSRRNTAKFTRFLDPAQCVLASQIARTYDVAFSAWGGYPDAERVIGCFHGHDQPPEHEEYPLVCLSSRIQTRFCSISHRDLLGAFMALGLTRSCIGDMIISDSNVYLFAAEQTADFIAESLTSAGKMALSFSALQEIPVMPEPKGSSFSGVVSSLRLDAVLACAYRLSRSESQESIRAGLVKVNHLPCEKTDFLLREGALLSVKGLGRVRLSSIGGMTKKQRIGITMFRYE